MKILKILLFIYLCFLFSISVSAWDRFGDSTHLRGSFMDDFGMFNNSTILKNEISKGAYSQILINDLDNDGISDIIFHDNENLYIYKIENNALIFQSSYFIGSAVAVSTPAIFPDSDGNNLNEIVIVWDKYGYVFEFNGSKQFNKISIIEKKYMTNTIYTNVMCDVEHDYNSENICWFGASDGYIIQWRISSPFPIFPYDMLKEPETDGIFDNNINFLGDTSTDKPRNIAIALRGHDAGSINEIRIGINSTNGNPENNSFVYNIKICEISDGELTNSAIGGDCSNSLTTIKSNFNASQNFGSTAGIKTIMLDTSYYLEETTNYSLIFEYVSGISINGNNDNYVLNTDTAPTSHIYKLDITDYVYLYSSVPQLTLFGSTVSSITKNDVCPSDNDCLKCGTLQPPLLIQDMTDGLYKLAVVHDNNFNNRVGIGLIDVDTLTLDTKFNYGQGYVDNLGDIFGMIAGNIGGGSESIIFNVRYDDLSLKGVYIKALDLTGHYVYSQNLVITSVCSQYSMKGNWRSSYPFQLQIEDTSNNFLQNVYCGIGTCKYLGDSTTQLNCYSLPDTTEMFSYTSPKSNIAHLELSGHTIAPVYTARMRYTDSTQPQVICQSGILTLNFSSMNTFEKWEIKNYTNAIIPNNIHILTIADANNDGSLDVLGSRVGGIHGNEIYFASSNFTNQPPIVNNSYAYGGFGSEYGVNNPYVCLNSAINFFARDSDVFISGNYKNDYNSETERIVTNCGYDNSGLSTVDYTNYLQTGAYHQDNPDIDCYYNKTGIYRVRLFMQDLVNNNDTTQGNIQEIFVNVINGTMGIDCNNFNEYTETGDITIGMNGSIVGDPCIKNTDCLTRNCEYGVCVYKRGHEPCINDYECLSQECINGLCKKAPVWDRVQHNKDMYYGDDKKSNNLISLIISVGIAIVIIIGSKGHIMGIITGLVMCIASMLFFTVVGWLSAWIMFAVFFVLILLTLLLVLLFKGD